MPTDPMKSQFSPEQIKLFELLAPEAKKRGVELFLVGGTVRDLLLGELVSDQDIDLIVAGDARVFASHVVELVGGSLKIFERFFTAKILAPPVFSSITEIDLASARSEVYPKPGSLPEVALADLTTDLRRRDFTINTLALPLDRLINWDGSAAQLRNLVIDNLNGLADLASRTIRVLHQRSFIDDPTRLFRAARYALRIGAVLEPETAALFRAAVVGQALHTISAARKLAELEHIMHERKAGEILNYLFEQGVFEDFPIFTADKRSGVVESLTKLSELGLSDPALVFRVALSIFFENAGAGRLELFKEFGFGKRFFSKVQRDLGEIESGLNSELSDEGLIFKLLGSGLKDIDNLKAEALRRKLFRAV